MTRRKVPAVEPRSRVDIEKIAQRVLRELVPNYGEGRVPVHDVFESLDRWDKRLTPGVEDLETGNLGEMTPTGDVLLSPATYEQLVMHDPRARFTTSHEVGHAILHFKQLNSNLKNNNRKLYRRNSIPAFRDPEWQANAFAAALLMPSDQMHRLKQQEPNNLVDKVARLFVVSRESASIRIERLNLS